MNNKYNLFFFLTLFLFFQYGHTQYVENNLDSLFTAYQKLPDSKAKVDSLINLSWKDRHNLRPDIPEMALDIATKIYYTDGIAKVYNLKGVLARKNNNFTKSVEYHKRALSFYKQSLDTFSKIRCLHNLGVSLRKIDFNDEAYEYYIQALELSRKRKDSNMISYIYNGIGNVFVNTEEYDKAKFYFKKAYELDLKRNNLKGQDYNLVNLGEVFIYKNKLDSAEVYLNKGLDLEKIIYKARDLGVIYNFIGLLNKKKKEYIDAIYYYNKAIPHLKEKNIKRYLSNSYIQMGSCKAALKKYDLAKSDIEKGMKIAEKINSPENIYLAYNSLVDLYVKQKNYKKALDAKNKSVEFHNKIVNTNAKQSIITTQVIYETKQKDKKILQLAKEKQAESEKARKSRLKLVITGFISFLAIVFLYFFFKIKRRNTDLELQQKNSEIQNYILKINNMENCDKTTNSKSKEEIKQKLEELDLTPREIDVLKLISEGYNNDEIAEKMYISKNTVKSHIKRIYIKLDVKNRIQAINKIK